MDLSEFVDILNRLSWLIKLAATLTATAVIWRFLFIPLRTHARKVANLLEAVSDAYPILQQMSKDFKPNGGNSLRDVVDRIEKSLYLFEQKYRAVVEFQEIGVFETDSTGKYTWVSDKWMDITNQSWLDASNNGWIADVSAEERDKVWHEWETAVSQTRQFSMTYKIHDKPDMAKTIRSLAIPVKDKDGKVIAYLGKIVEISVLGGEHAG